MNRYHPLTDENAVVAFLSYTDERRNEAALHLAQNPSALELLCMAREALDALDRPAPRTSRPPQKRQRKYDLRKKTPH